MSHTARICSGYNLVHKLRITCRKDALTRLSLLQNYESICILQPTSDNKSYSHYTRHSKSVKQLMSEANSSIFMSIYKINKIHVSAASSQKQALSKHVKKDNFSEKAKEATKTTYYAAVVLVGLGITALLGYTIFRELFASFSPQTIYSAAVKECINNTRIQDMLGGDDLKSYGEESRRGRRQHISHTTYEVEGQRGMRIRFHLKGSRRAATVNLDVRDSSTGWYYRYMYVELDQYPFDVIVVQDNRGITDAPSHSQELPSSAVGAHSHSDVGELTPLFPQLK